MVKYFAFVVYSLVAVSYMEARQHCGDITNTCAPGFCCSSQNVCGQGPLHCADDVKVQLPLDVTRFMAQNVKKPHQQFATELANFLQKKYAPKGSYFNVISYSDKVHGWNEHGLSWTCDLCTLPSDGGYHVMRQYGRSIFIMWTSSCQHVQELNEQLLMKLTTFDKDTPRSIRKAMNLKALLHIKSQYPVGYYLTSAGVVNVNGRHYFYTSSDCASNNTD